MDFKRCRLIAMGSSAGGLDVYRQILPALARTFPVPIVIVQHLAPRGPGLLVSVLQNYTVLTVCEVEDKMPIESGLIYVAPPNYHVLIEPDLSFSLTVEDPVCYSRPSIDVTFECVADVYGPTALGVLLSGANHDGAAGLKRMHDAGAQTWVQTPASAMMATMPQSAVDVKAHDTCLEPAEMAKMLGQWIH